MKVSCAAAGSISQRVAHPVCVCVCGAFEAPVVKAPDREVVGLQPSQLHVHGIPDVALHRAVEKVVQRFSQVCRCAVLPGSHLRVV